MKSVKVFTTAFLIAVTSVSIAERRITKSDLPAPVQQTADAQSAGAAIVGYAKDIEERKVEYEVQLMVDGHTKDVTIDPQGNLLEVEEQVQTDALPASVLSGLHAQAGKAGLQKLNH